MLARLLAAAIACLAVVFGVVGAMGAETGAAAGAPGAGGAGAVAEYTVTGPVEHENLTVFLIHGADKIKGKSYLTLEEGLAQKKVVVRETGNVNELTIENVSDDDVYVQSGDIVKGGKQDRTFQYDMVLGGKSGKVGVSAFCVESGRWNRRGGENAAQFDSSSSSVSSKAMKVASKSAGDQGEVWKSVEQAQQKLSASSGEKVNDERSATSLQLSLENKKVQEAVDGYCKALGAAVKEQGDVVGYAFAINGVLNSVDIYGSHDLFMKMWEKNLHAAATEAFSELKKDGKWTPLTAEAVKSCLAEAAGGKASDKELSARVKLVKRESQANWSYETFDKKAGEASPAHTNILTRDPESEKMLKGQSGQLNMQGGNDQVRQQEVQQRAAPNGPAR